MRTLNVQQFTLVGRNGAEHRFTGQLLGAGTSHQTHHYHNNQFARRGEKCSACRWFEVAIYRRTADAKGHVPVGADHGFDYVVHTVGATIVPGEQRLSRVEYTTSSFEVVELLTIRPNDREPYMMTQSARALARAAELDDGIREAYVNRAVA